MFNLSEGFRDELWYKWFLSIGTFQYIMTYAENNDYKQKKDITCKWVHWWMKYN
jgi:hypothetical protein